MLRLATCSALAALALLGGCDVTTDDRSVIWLTPPEAVTKLNTPSGLFTKETRGVWIDPRSPKAYEEGHIAGAISLPLPDMRDAAASELNGYNLFLVYDADFSDVMAKAGAKRLLELGFTEVYALKGGLRAWKNDGYTIVTGKQPK